MKKLKIKGLDCASCAYDIEKALEKEGFKKVQVNFMTGELFVDGDIEKAKSIVKKVKPEIEVVDKEKEHNHEHHEFDAPKRMLYIIISSLVLFIVGILIRYYYNHENILVLTIFLTSYLFVGWKVLKNAVVNSIHGNIFDENFLIAVATIGAFLIKEYPEATAVMLFYTTGEFLQDLAVNRSRRSIEALLSLKAEYANLKVGEKLIKIKPEELKTGDIIVIKPGEKIPVDGTIVEGKSTVDTSALTGESIPREVEKGDEILSGMVNLNGVLTVKVSKELKESTVSKILELVENASTRKAKTEKFITRFARYYTPVVVGIALIISFVPPLFTGDSFSVWLYRALVILVISCPCALVLSIPLGYFSGVGKSAKKGILVKGSNYLDALSEASIVAFDKTGTLTKGIFKVTNVVTKNGFTKEMIIKLAALAEIHSNHPIAKAIKEAYGGMFSENEVETYEEIPGYGVKARIDGTEIMVGNDRLLHRFSIEHDTCHVKGTVVHVVVNKKYAGYLIISDEVKEDALKAVIELRKLDIKKIVMVTGDNENVAREIAKQLGLDDFYANLLPQDKIKVIEELMKKNEKGKVVFVGDGINDAPVLARSDVGVAMGALGSDAAIETADVIIMDDKPSKLPEGIKIARKTKKIVWQNIIFALGVKLIFISFGIFGKATMWEAVFADVGVTLIAVLNSMRILK